MTARESVLGMRSGFWWRLSTIRIRDYGSVEKETFLGRAKKGTPRYPLSRLRERVGVRALLIFGFALFRGSRSQSVSSAGVAEGLPRLQDCLVGESVFLWFVSFGAFQKK